MITPPLPPLTDRTDRSDRPDRTEPNTGTATAGRRRQAGAPGSCPDPGPGPGPGPGPDLPRIVPRRHTGRRLAAAAALLVLAALIDSVVRNDAFQWDVVVRYFTTAAVLDGLLLTLWLTAAVMVLGFLLGTVLAVMRLSANPVLATLSWGYVWIFRSTPLLVQLLFWFNIGALYPTLGLGIPYGPQIVTVQTVNLLGPALTAVIGLTLHEAACAAEVVRGGILSVEPGQTEAAQALGLSRRRTLRRIVIPQAMRSIVPTAGNTLIGTLKGTSIVSVLAVHDLLYSVQLVYNQTYQVIPMLMVATLWYVAVTTVLSACQHYIERHYARGTSRPMRAASPHPVASAVATLLIVLKGVREWRMRRGATFRE
ncbi:amino acid ABC transporter permease [Streptomyces sp. FIT100]|uniref:amino acid ABC transporter permease n=1 Tax=Streptomyces sp. FIT100 TaxID=2837956 RepID=UPI0022006F5F|nr:amino acid ABC transporter permease [Streptomyces sp. FIT100]